jgi:hypothetical protein
MSCIVHKAVEGARHSLNTSCGLEGAISVSVRGFTAASLTCISINCFYFYFFIFIRLLHGNTWTSQSVIKLTTESTRLETYNLHLLQS